MRKKILKFSILLFLTYLLLPTAVVFAKSTPKISSKSASLYIGQTKTLYIYNTTSTAKWSSSKKSVATVTNKGLVKAKNPGRAIIKAKVGKRTLKCKVSVKTPTLSKTSMNLKVGYSSRLDVYGVYAKVAFSSSNSSVASISGAYYNKYSSNYCYINAKQAGKATIKAKINNKTLKCNVTVTQAESPSTPVPSPSSPSPTITVTPNVEDVNITSLTFTTSDGGSFVQGQSSAKVTFVLDVTTSNVTVEILNNVDETVAYMPCGTVYANSSYTVTWDGMIGSTVAPTGTYYALVTAGSNSARSEGLAVRSGFAGGTGSEGSPFLVSTLEQLKNVEKYNGYYFQQKNNIVGDKDIISGMFDSDEGFNGQYDGNGYSISNIIVQDTKENLALFITVGTNGVLKNITLDNVTVIGMTNVGTLVRDNKGKIQNCTVTNCNLNGTHKASMLCQTNEKNGSVIGCTVSNCNLRISGGGYYNDAGGLLDNNYGKAVDCTVKNLSIYLTGASYAHISGLVQENYGMMYNCGAEEVILGTDRNNESGGVCRLNKGTITGCYFSGTATTGGVYDNQGLYIE